MRKRTLTVLAAATIAASAPGGYRIVQEIKVGGDGSWDYVTMDSTARRLYVSHATKVVVIDVDSGQVIGTVPDTPGVHGIALAPELGRGFTSNGGTNTATIFDLKTLKQIGQVKTGTNPDAIQYEPLSGRVFTFNRSNDATAFEAKSGKVQSTIPLGGKPEFSVTDGTGKIYVNIEDTNEMVELDAKKLAITRRYSIKPCNSPSGLAMDAKTRRLISVCDNNIMAISDPDSGKVVATAAIGDEPDGAGFDPGLSMAFSSNRDGTLTVVRNTSGKWEVVENATTKPGARTLAIDEKTHKLYLPTAQLGPAAASTPQSPKPKPTIVPGTFEVLVLSR